jgi:hypothetical protein
LPYGDLFLFKIDFTSKMSNAGKESKMEIETDADRLSSASAGAPETPQTQAQGSSDSSVPPTVAQLAEQAISALLEEQHSTLFDELGANLEAFRAMGRSAELDPAAYKAIRLVYPGMLAPLADMLRYGTSVREQMAVMNEKRREVAQAFKAQTEQLNSVTLAGIKLKQLLASRGAAKPVLNGGGAGAAGALTSPFNLFTAPGSAASMMETSLATSATSVFIQGPAPKHVSAPVNHPMIRDYRESVKVALREGRSVRHEVLISAAARAQISLKFWLLAYEPGFCKFWLLAYEPGFCKEFPHGARGAAEEAQLEQPAKAPET